MIPAVMPTYARYDLAFDHGEGAYLWDTEGRRYLDFGAGIAVAAIGHCHPHLVDAIREQAGKLMHTSNLYHIPGQEALAERLVANTFADAVFFNNSGNEAVELGVKMMRRYHWANGHPERYRVITVSGAFHGRSLAMLSAGKQEKHLTGFGPEVDGFDQVAFDNLNELKAAIGPETAGILVEPVQGEGGIRPMSKEYLQSLRKIADEFGLLLMFDEVQSGVGRTGKLYAYEWAGIAPDILASAKGIGGGFPLGATLATEKVADAMTAGSHGSTYGGNPLAMAAGNAVLDVILAPGFLEGVQKIAGTFMAGLEDIASKHPSVFEIARGTGLMLGLKCADGVTNGDVVKKLMENGLLSVPAGDNVVRFVPPLVITADDVTEALSIIEKTATDFEGGA
ncbi:MAG: aspartate aminotransferase family protein [Rhodospirillales bacterium]|nr:aspartate aminotransferase family protein [Rhodospirillales bacterium]MBO6787991.1 aspartate aminotransferase family protein [Rhodospirillales bacterium]